MRKLAASFWGFPPPNLLHASSEVGRRAQSRHVEWCLRLSLSKAQQIVATVEIPYCAQVLLSVWEWPRIRPADLAILFVHLAWVDAVELVIAHGQRLLHHNRRQRTVFSTWCVSSKA